MSGRREVADRVRRERGERLCAQRVAIKNARGKSMTQGELGALVDLTAQQVSKYEGGKDLISASWAYRFAQALGCSFQAIFVGGRFELAEPRAAFHHEHDGADELSGLLTLCDERLTQRRRSLLRDVILELLDEEEATVPSPQPASVARVQGIL